MKQNIIPFQIGGPIQEPEKFAGRAELLDKLSNALLSLQNVSLHGERRTGKTSLLLCLAHPAFSSVIRFPETSIPVYFNFQDFTNARAASVWQAIAEAVGEQIMQRHPGGQAESERFLDAIAKCLASPENTELFSTGFGRAFRHLHNSGFKFHLLFDEFEQTSKNPDLGDTFYNALRSLPTRAKNISYVIATRTGLAALQKSYDQISSPFFNIFTTLKLEPFQENEVYHFVFSYFAQAGFDISLAEKLCGKLPFLHDITGYHPFFLQTLCYHLCEHLDETEWPEGYAQNEALKAFEKDAEPHFEYYWKISSKKEQDIIKKLALRQPADSESETGMVQSLKDRCLVVQTGKAEQDFKLFSSYFSKFASQKDESEKTCTRHAVQVFISYFNKDLNIAKKLYEDIRLKGMRPWMRSQDILPGQDRKAMISSAIKKSNYFIALFSSNPDSDIAREELNTALELSDQFPLSKILIIPARIDDCKTDERLETFQQADLFPSYETGLNKILSVLVPASPPFVNREDELTYACTRYAVPSIFFEAPRGYGKTELLKAIEQRHSRDRWLCVYVETPKNTDSATELSKEVAARAGYQDYDSTPDDAGVLGFMLAGFLKNRVSSLGAVGAALLIDNIENLPPGESDSFLNGFLFAVQTLFQDMKLRIRIAGRCNGPLWKNQRKKLELTVKPLTLFQFRCVRDIVRFMFPGHKEPDLCSAHLMHVTGGHPGCIAEIMESINPAQSVEYNFNTNQENYKTIVLPVINEVRKSVPESLQDIFDILSVFRRYDYGLLKKIADAGIIMHKGADNLERELTATYLVKRKKGFIQDDIVRRLLVMGLRWKNFHRFTELCESARNIYEQNLQKTKSRAEFIAIEVLYQELQLAYYGGEQTSETRETLRSTFFADNGILNRYLKILASKPDAPNVKASFTGLLENEKYPDWEFQFAVNFFLRKDQYNNDPYMAMIKHVRNFFGQ